MVFEGDPLLFLAPQEVAGSDEMLAVQADPDVIRPDLAESNARHAFGYDANRPEAVARRRTTNQRTVRENIEQLCDPGSFIEYGALAFAAQRRRRELDDLIANTPGDGIVTGLGTVNAKQFGEAKARCAVMAYDPTVLAGTQGVMNHRKKDRLLTVAEEWKLPVVCFAEGGGGRPGDTDFPIVAGLDTPTFRQYARLSGQVPRIGINSGRCFAGNAALLGCSDVVIATANSNIGMGGPAMIEGGGLGVFRPRDVGPMSVQVPNGVVDVAVADEIEAIEVAKKYLAYFQGPLAAWDCVNQKELRHLIPENRLRVYESRKVIETLADTGSVLELRRDFAPGLITALVRIEGAPFGLIANNPMFIAGAIDAPCADKAARFLQLCDAFGLPILSLCDTPGFMVGPEAEKTALVRRVSRMFVVGGALSVPIFTVVLRKGYGLGAQAMAGGSFHAPFFIVSWPTGEFGGMGPGGRRPARLPPGARSRTDAGGPARRCSRSWWRSPMPAARRSTWRPIWRSTTSSTPRIHAAGSCAATARSRPGSQASGGFSWIRGDQPVAANRCAAALPLTKMPGAWSTGTKTFDSPRADSAWPSISAPSGTRTSAILSSTSILVLRSK